METTRQQKIGRLIQKELGEYFRFENRSLFGNSMITVTKVHVTKDLSIARVYLSLFGKGDKDSLMKEIQSHSKDIRYKLGVRTGKQLRIIPELEFYLDDSLDYIENIEKLLSN